MNRSVCLKPSRMPADGGCADASFAVSADMAVNVETLRFGRDKLVREPASFGCLFVRWSWNDNKAKSDPSPIRDTMN